MATKVTPADGLMIPDPRLVDKSNLQANTAASLTSSYTQAGSRPGKPVAQQTGSRLAPIVGQAQSTGIATRVVHSGLPGRGEGVSLAYKIDGEADDAYRGWCIPNWISAQCMVERSASDNFTSIAVATHPQTQKVVTIYHEAGGVNACKVWDPETWEWSFGGTPGNSSGSMSLLALPSGRLIHFVFPGFFDAVANSIYYSDDVGTTWAVLTDAALPGASYGRSQAVRLNGDIALYVRSSVISGTMEQYASSDGGMNFDLVGTTGTVMDTAAYAGPSAVAVGGRILCAYIRTSDRYPVVAILGSAYQQIETGTESVVVPGAKDDICLVPDPNGTVWCFVRDSTDDIDVYVSYDYGDTWLTIEIPMHKAISGDDYLTNLHAASTNGAVMMLHNTVAASSTLGGSVNGLLLGGWSNVSAGAAGGGSGAGAHVLLHRTAFGQGGHTWLPFEEPDNYGWSRTGTAGTLISPGVLQISTSSATGYYESESLGTDLQAMVSLDMQVVSGGATGGAAPRPGFKVVVADNTDHYELWVYASTTGFAAYDIEGGVALGAGVVTYDMTEPVQFLVWLRDEDTDPNCQIWYRRHGSTTWALLEGNVTKNTVSPAANGLVTIGHTASSTAVSRWRHVCYNTGEFARLTYDVATRLHGKPLTSSPVPIPEVGSSDLVATLAVQGGPGRWAEEWQIDPRYDYPIDALFSGLSPSPSVKWRSVGTPETILVFDLGHNSVIGGSLGLAALGANFKSAMLEYWTGSSWAQYVSLDLIAGGTVAGKPALTYDLTGDTLTPRTGTDEGARYLYANELAGGSAILDLDGTPEGRRIVGNTPGAWIDENTTPQVSIRLDGIDGGEVTPGDCFVYFPSGINIDTAAGIGAATTARYWRIRITADQTTAEGYYEAGHLGIYRLQPFGTAVSWGDSVNVKPNITVSRSAYGTSRVQEVGPPAATWSLSFADGELHTRIRQSPLSLESIGSASGPRLVAQEDSAYLLRGILEETRSGELLVIAVRNLGDRTGGVTLTDRTRFVYGRMMDTIGITHAAGTIGVDEFLRTESITIEEVK